MARHPVYLCYLMHIMDYITIKRPATIIKDHEVAVILPWGKMLKDIDQPLDLYLQSHLFVHFPFQCVLNRLAKIYFAARHYPEIQKWGDAPFCQKHPPRIIHNYRHH